MFTVLTDLPDEVRAAVEEVRATGVTACENDARGVISDWVVACTTPKEPTPWDRAVQVIEAHAADPEVEEMTAESIATVLSDAGLLAGAQQ